MAEKTAGGALAKRPTGADKNNATAVPLGDGEISGDGGDQARRADLPGEVTRQRRRRRRGVQTAWQREEAPSNALALDTEDLDAEFAAWEAEMHELTWSITLAALGAPVREPISAAETEFDTSVRGTGMFSYGPEMLDTEALEAEIAMLRALCDADQEREAKEWVDSLGDWPADLLGSTFPAEPTRAWCCIEGPDPIWYLPVD